MDAPWFEIAVFLVAMAAGGATAVAGAGVDSLLVPLFAVQYDFKLAVAAVALPHLVANLTRTVQLRRHIDRKLLGRFGVMAAVASIAGAFVQQHVDSPVVSRVFAGLLVFAGIVGFTRVLERFHAGRRTAWAAGAASGFFGGLVGEQGGLRAAALMGFGLDKELFVATNAAVGVITDAVRLPVYYARFWSDLHDVWVPIAVALVGALVGIAGGRVALHRLPQDKFSRVVSAVIVAVGVLLFFRH